MGTKRGLLPVLATCFLFVLSSCDFSAKIPGELLTKEAAFHKIEQSPFSLDQYMDNHGYAALPATGTQKILVLPILFRDSDCTMGGNTCAAFTEQLTTALSGTSYKDNELFLSVSDYYRQSSYGQLSLEYVIAEPSYATQPLITYRTAVRHDPGLAVGLSNEIVDTAYSIYRDVSGDTAKYHSVMAVYYADYRSMNSVEQELFWSYVVTKAGGAERDFSNYMWTSYFTLFDEEKYGLDTHTFIHETGHLLGLDDYYNSDNSLYTPASVLDVMSGNVGDHNAYSKFLLGWIDPIVPESEGKIVLRPFESSGDALLLTGKNFNGSPFDEYIALIYYTPTGPNRRDLKYPQFGMYGKPGLLAYHVDSRLARVHGNGNYSLLSTLDEIEDSWRLQIAHSNSPSYTLSNNKDHYLLELLDKSGTNMALQGYVPTSASLFGQKDSFGVRTYADFSFHSTEKPLYDFYVGSLSDQEAVIYLAAN